MRIKIILLIFLLFSSYPIWAQSGCTDSQATNFNPSALINDGSCQYAPTNYTLGLIANLNDSLNENSGLVWIENRLFTFNDSGSGTNLFEITTSGTIIRTIHVSNANNIDWEAITADENYLYIGDFGNNNGNRTDLCIYRLLKTDATNSVLDTISATKMSFQWSDQIDFTSATNLNNFDCEAFYASNDSLFLFTKNWVDLQTKYYTLPKFWVDTLQAEYRSQFNVDGLITDVCLDSTQEKIYLLGYKNNGSNFYTSFVWCLWDFSGNDVFTGNKRRIEIGNVLTVSQTEGIAITPTGDGFISAEKIVTIITIPAKLFSFNFNSFFDGTSAIEEQTIELPFYISYSSDSYDNIEINIKKEFQLASIIDIQGKEVLKIEKNYTQVPLHTFHGIHFIKIDGDVFPFILNY